MDCPRSLLIAALVLTACKGDGSDDTGAATDTTTNATPATPAGNTDDTPTTSQLPTTTEDTGGTLGTSNGEATSNTTNPGTTPGETGTTADVDTVATSQTTDVTTVDTTEPDTSTTNPGETTDASTSTTSDDTTSGDETTGEPVVLDIEVIITADNAYSFAYGTLTNIGKFFGGVEAVTAGQIFNCGEGPEKYIVPGADAQNATHLYIVAWDDSAVSNGVLARFHRTDGGQGFGDDVFTGYHGWQACATGLKYEVGSKGPPLDVINQYINKCNNGDLDPNNSSGGWVDEVGTALGAVAFGEDNTTPYDGGPKAGNEFPLVCPMDMPADARWMWFDPAPMNPASPFLYPGGGNGPNAYHQFLLFRLAAELIPEPQ